LGEKRGDAKKNHSKNPPSVLQSVRTLLQNQGIGSQGGGGGGFLRPRGASANLPRSQFQYAATKKKLIEGKGCREKGGKKKKDMLTEGISENAATEPEPHWNVLYRFFRGPPVNNQAGGLGETKKKKPVPRGVNHGDGTGTSFSDRPR